MTWQVIEADCVEQMKLMDEASVDAVVTDPPYSLRFMSRAWDDQGEGAQIEESHRAWATEALRVLKPGGHLLAFGGTRTYHRLACAIEDAGFEIRDSVIWLYGSGFPKSLDVSKAIDRAAGAEREVVGTKLGRPGMAKDGSNQSFDSSVNTYGDGDTLASDITAPATPEAQRWQGWGTALKPAHEPIVVARKPLIGTVRENVERFGTGALAIDRCRIGLVDGVDDSQIRTMNRSEKENDGWGMNTTGADEPQVVKPEGRWPANVALSHLPECERVGERRVKAATGPEDGPRHTDGGNEITHGKMAGVPGRWHADPDGLETVEAWSCVENCPILELDRQSEGQRASKASATGTAFAATGAFPIENQQPHGYADSGSASRFFYVAKASRAERNAGLEGFEAGDGAAIRPQSRECNVCGSRSKRPGKPWPACGHDDWQWVEDKTASGVEGRDKGALRNAHPT